MPSKNRPKPRYLRKNQVFDLVVPDKPIKTMLKVSSVLKDKLIETSSKAGVFTITFRPSRTEHNHQIEPILNTSDRTKAMILHDEIVREIERKGYFNKKDYVNND